ncbi:MAG: hypothetical protein H0X54_06465 [Propionibacteriales bacterium]|nr:hypothetical protein [Propionibacteriales bacterium]
MARLVAAARRHGSAPFASVAGGSALGQLALLASLPVVARIFSPAQIGVFGVVLAVGNVACIVVTARLEQVLPRLRPDRRWAVARLGAVAGVALAIPAGIAFSAVLGHTAPMDLVSTALLVTSLVLLNVGTFASLAVQDYRSVAALRLSNGVITAMASVVGGLIHQATWVLVVAYAVGNLAGAGWSFAAVARLRRERGPDRSAEVVAGERLGWFALNVGSGAVLSNLSVAMPLIGASILFGDDVAGSFFLARRLLMGPTQLIAASVSEVSYAMVAREGAGRMSVFFHDWLRRSTVPAVMLLALGLVAAPLAPIVVGDGYADLTWVIILLTTPAVAQMIATSFANLLLALRLEHIRTMWNVARLSGLVLIFLWAQETDAGYVSVVATYAAWLLITYGILLVLTWQGVRRAGAAL